MFDSIDPLKDVDGCHPVNQGRLYRGDAFFEPCTPKGILTLLDHYKIELESKDVTIIGKGDIFYALRSSSVNLDDFLNKEVVVRGSFVEGYPVDGGPEYIDVKEIE